MAFFVVIAVFAVVFNLLADIIYAVLDPRIRIGGLSHRRMHTDHPGPRPAGTPVGQDSPRRPTSTRRRSSRREVAGLSQGQIVRRRFFRHQGAMISLILLVLIVAARRHEHRVGPDPGLVEVGLHRPRAAEPERASRRCRCGRTFLGGAGIQLGDHPFGLDNENGKDMFALTMRGVQTDARRDLRARRAVDVDRRRRRCAVRATTAAGSTRVLMRFTDVIIVIPLLLITAVAGYALGLTGMWPVAFALGLFTWTGLARLVRAEFLALRERSSSTPRGWPTRPDRRIIFKHILPNTVGTIVVSVTLLMGAGILTEAALGFLGFGVQSPEVSLGTLVSDYDGRILDPAVAVPVAGRLRHHHRAVPAVHRRRPARRLRSAPEADPQAQGPRARSGRSSSPSAYAMSDDERRWRASTTRTAHGSESGAAVPRDAAPVVLEPGFVEVTGVAQPRPSDGGSPARPRPRASTGRSPGRTVPARPVPAAGAWRSGRCERRRSVAIAPGGRCAPST